MKKRLLSALLALCMMLTMMPTVAFAAEGEGSSTASETVSGEKNIAISQPQVVDAQDKSAQDRNMPSNDVYTINPDMTQIEVNAAIESAQGEIVIEPGNYGIAGKKNHIKINLSKGGQTVRLLPGDYKRLMFVVLSEDNTLIADDTTIYGDVSTVYNQSPAIYIPYGSLELQGNLKIDDHDYGVILGYTHAKDESATFCLAQNAQLDIVNCSTVGGNSSYDNGIVCNGEDYFSYVDSQGDGTRGSAITTKGKGYCTVIVSENAVLNASDNSGSGIYSITVSNFTLDIRPEAKVNLTDSAQGLCMNTDYTGSVDVKVDNAELTITGNSSNGITGQSKPYLLDIKNDSTVKVDDNGGIGINNFYIKIADSTLSVLGSRSHGATNVALDATNSKITCSDNAYIGLNITKYNSGETATNITNSTITANTNGGPGIRFYIGGGVTNIKDSRIYSNGNGVGDETYGYEVKPGDSGYWAGIVGKGEVNVMNSFVTSDSAGGYSLYNDSTAPATLYIDGTDVVAFNGKADLSNADIFDDWNSQGNTGRTYVTGGSLQAYSQQMTKGFTQTMNQQIPKVDGTTDKQLVQYSAPVNATSTALTRFDLNQEINTVVGGDGDHQFTVWDPNGEQPYEYYFRYNTAEEDLDGEGGNAYVWTPVTVIHYDATEGTIDVSDSTAVEGDVALENTRGDNSAIGNSPVAAENSYIDATDYTICGNSVALSEGKLPSATRADYVFAGWYYAVGQDAIEQAAAYAKNKDFDELYELLKTNGKKLDETTLTNNDGYDVAELTVYAIWEKGIITITPADITIYTGGDGYDSVVTNEEGNDVDNSATNGLPTPGFYITLPDAVNEWLLANVDDAYKVKNAAGDEIVDLSHFLKFTYNQNGESRTWELKRYDDKPNDNNSMAYNQFIYRIEPAEVEDPETGKKEEIPIRLQFTDGNKFMTSDDFAVNLNDLFHTYDMSIYAGDLNQNLVKAVLTVNNQPVEYSAVVENGKLTVRGVTDNGTHTTEVVTEDPATEVSSVTAQVDEGTTFRINGSQLEVEDGSKVKLLVDSMVPDSNNTLVNSAVNEFDAIPDDYNHQTRYLDLVDTSNGNVYVTASDTVTLYWAYPEGTDANTEFHLVHYEGLDRNDNTDLADGDYKMTLYSEDNNNLQMTPQGIKFTVTSFSPFALFWEDDNGGSSGGGNNKPDDLNTEDHFAYIIGYPKDYRTGEPTDDESLWPVEPQGDITRAEVATIFFRMLTDDARSENWSQTNDYTDVASTDWYNNAISTLSNMGIISGDPSGAFRPDDSITRAEFTKIAVGFFDKAGDYVDGTYDDVSSSDWYADFIDAAVDLGLIEGYPDGTIRPEATITRAEACTIVNRTLGRVPDKDHLLPADEMRVWPDNSDTNEWYYAQIQEATNSHDYEWIGEENDQIENWTEKLEDRDWAQLEREWSDANSAPGGEVVD